MCPKEMPRSARGVVVRCTILAAVAFVRIAAKFSERIIGYDSVVPVGDLTRRVQPTPESDCADYGESFPERRG